MPNYSKCVMYKLICNDINVKELYVGSTCNFTRRKCGHKSACNNINSKDYNYKVYQFIRDNGGWTNWTMTAIKKFPCEDKMDKLIEERRIMEELGATLNIQVPGRTHNEYNKQHYSVNKDKINEKQRKKHNCSCGGKYTNSNEQQHFRTNKHKKYLNSLLIL